LRSVSSIVIAPASTGRESSKRKAVKSTDQANNGMISNFKPLPRIFAIVVIKLMEPRIEDTPARCREKIPKSTALPWWPRVERGGYTVQPVPTPDSMSEEKSKRQRAGGSNQNERLLRRGKAISGAPIRRGANQLPKPPIIVGITKKKIIIKAWAVTTVL